MLIKDLFCNNINNERKELNLSNCCIINDELNFIINYKNNIEFFTVNQLYGLLFDEIKKIFKIKSSIECNDFTYVLSV